MFSEPTLCRAASGVYNFACSSNNLQKDQGMKAGRTVQTILHLAGFRNVKSKVVGSRNPHNTVKALFKALNAVNQMFCWPGAVLDNYNRFLQLIENL
ncbi:uncharacterized protein [Nicotiana sylvestris]|uniref:uncharacterized protein n=1 Tax=Nicotiana sylvestris TaxID=4096 RepID=UPI00388CA86D